MFAQIRYLGCNSNDVCKKHVSLIEEKGLECCKEQCGPVSP